MEYIETSRGLCHGGETRSYNPSPKETRVPPPHDLFPYCCQRCVFRVHVYPHFVPGHITCSHALRCRTFQTPGTLYTLGNILCTRVQNVGTHVPMCSPALPSACVLDVLQSALFPNEHFRGYRCTPRPVPGSQRNMVPPWSTAHTYSYQNCNDISTLLPGKQRYLTTMNIHARSYSSQTGANTSIKSLLAHSQWAANGDFKTTPVLQYIQYGN